MNAKVFLLRTAFAAVLLTGAGCASAVPEEPPSAAVSSQEDTGEQLGAKLLDAIKTNSYKNFASALAGRTSFDVTKKDFEASCGNVHEKYGKLVSASYLTELETPLVRNRIWKVRFVKELTGGKTQTQDMLFRLVTGNTDDGAKVLAFGFF